MRGNKAKPKKTLGSFVAGVSVSKQRQKLKDV